MKYKSKRYIEEIKKEADIWDKTAKNELKNNFPDYFYYKQTLPYKIYRNIFVKKMLSRVSANDKVLELGSYNGWFSLELARKGAKVDAHDNAKKAITIAEQYYKNCKRKEKFSGTINYHLTDLNFPSFPKNTYNIIVIRNVLHHLLNLDKLFVELNKSLHSNGIILIDDALPCGKKEALLSGILLTLLPTDIPYSQKLYRIFKKGNILKRTQGLVDAKGASPFEGISSGDDSIKCLKKYFHISHFLTFSAFIGTITGHLNMPKIIKEYVLMILNICDKFFIKLKLLRGTNFFLIANK